jgi:hypothetical protein
MPKINSPNPQSPYDFIASVIDSLRWAKEVVRRGQQQAADASVVEIMVNTKQGIGELRCAIQTLQPFTRSGNELLREGAELMSLAYEGVIRVDERLIAEMTALLNAASQGRPIGSGDLVDRFTTLQTQRGEMWKLLLPGAAGTTHGLVKFTDQGAPTGRLRLTRRQRLDALAALEATFGSVVRLGPRAGKAAVDGAAALLYGFIADPQWRAEDDA